MARKPTPEEMVRNVTSHAVVSPAEWLAARRELLAQEKELTRRMDAVSAARRALPWVRVEKTYAFESTAGQVSLGDLFDGRSQLIVYHFMFGPGWEEGCRGCSFVADHIDGANRHLAHHDVSVVAVSHAPLAELLPFKKRMGWKFAWVSSHGSDFNHDYHVSATAEELAAGRMAYNFGETEAEEEMPGVSVFYRDAEGGIFHTYSSYTRGLDMLLGAHHYLDLTPKGRNEETTMSWVRHHDKYEGAAEEKRDCCS